MLAPLGGLGCREKRRPGWWSVNEYARKRKLCKINSGKIRGSESHCAGRPGHGRNENAELRLTGVRNGSAVNPIIAEGKRSLKPLCCDMVVGEACGPLRFGTESLCGETCRRISGC